MTERERRENPSESFDGRDNLGAEDPHRQRVAKNPERIAFAIQQLTAHNIEFVIKNKANGHFHCRRKTDDALIQFYAGTGKIAGRNDIRGIHKLIMLCEGQIE